MVTVTEASTIVLAHALTSAKAEVRIEDAVGRVLGEMVFADRDFPPMDRVAMDGIAISFDFWSEGNTEFIVEGIQAAGTPQAALSHPGNCFEIMTGAVLPAGADTIIPYENVHVDSQKARIETNQVMRGQNIHRKGSDARAGTVLLQPGTLISAAEVALLAAVGKSLVTVFAFPPTAIISTGDELVAVSDNPAPHQQRRSNTYAILAAMRLMGWTADSFHLPDHREVVVGQLKEILSTHDVVILSGGVSKGKFDFIPGALESNGIVKRFYRVNQRPGKPFWFGTSADGRKTVFALPGNPVATFLCFYRYIEPWIRRSQQGNESPIYAVLAHDFEPPPGMTYFLQVSVNNEQGRLMAYPDAGGGSGDFANLKDVTGFLELPEASGTARTGEIFRYYPFRP